MFNSVNLMFLTVFTICIHATEINLFFQVFLTSNANVQGGNTPDVP